MKIKLSKNLRSFNCCYSLVDLFFERSFFGLCSWSGQSRSKTVDKYAFKSFRRIINCFFHCVRSVDGDFTFGECESFFKDRILKHSVQREMANSGRLSKIKHRPTGIPSKKYKVNVSKPEKIIFTIKIRTTKIMNQIVPIVTKIKRMKEEVIINIIIQVMFLKMI